MKQSESLPPKWPVEPILEDRNTGISGATFLAAFRNVAKHVGIIIAAIAVGSFPYDTDAPLSPAEIKAQRDYYGRAYDKPTADIEDTEYTRVAEQVSKTLHLPERVQNFVNTHGLHNKAVLEIGSGRGNLQDIVPNYTGLDISPNVKRFYHKRFVLGSATALPFAHNSFDAVWSIFVFEHVPNPEQALSEARRVVRDGGYMYLYPAWNVPAWTAEGYEVRPYSDFDLAGKLVKLSIPIRSSKPFVFAGLLPVRFVRKYFSGSGPTRLRYTRLKPNYEKYWAPDSDAVNSIDFHELILWFQSRGDECVNCRDSIFLPTDDPAVVIRVRK